MAALDRILSDKRKARTINTEETNDNGRKKTLKLIKTDFEKTFVTA